MPDQTDAVTRDLLWPMVYQPEPSDNGDWFLLPLDQLMGQGYTHVEIHFAWDGKVPNAANLIKHQPED